MKKLLIVTILFISSCMVPESCCDDHKSTYYPKTYYPTTYYQPTKVIVIKKDRPTNKRHTKVKINRHRKRK